jgi:hypothetical protein
VRSRLLRFTAAPIVLSGRENGSIPRFFATT